MNIQENISLKPFNTFGIDKKAKFFIQASSENDILQALEKSKELNLPLIILGGGSNILLTKDGRAKLGTIPSRCTTYPRLCLTHL